MRGFRGGGAAGVGGGRGEGDCGEGSQDSRVWTCWVEVEQVEVERDLRTVGSGPAGGSEAPGSPGPGRCCWGC